MLDDHMRRPEFFRFDQDHPLAPDELCLLWEDLSNLPIDHVTGQRCTPGAFSNRMFWEPKQGYQLMGFDTGDTGDQAYIVLPNGGLSHSTSQPWSLTWLGGTLGTDGDNRGVFIGTAATSADYVWMKYNGDLSINDGSQRVLARSFDWHRMAWNTVVFTAPGYDFYRDGVYQGSITVCSSAIAMPHVGASFNTSTFNFVGWLGAVYAHGRALQAAEIAALHNAPYQFLRPLMPHVLGMAVAAAPPASNNPWFFQQKIMTRRSA